jgi:hypothetical protein
MYEQSTYDFEPYNNNYYEYMKDKKNIYNGLDGSMINYSNPGELTI